MKFFEIINERLTVALMIFSIYLLCIYFILIIIRPYNQVNYAILHKVEKNMIITQLSNTLVGVIWTLAEGPKNDNLKLIIFIYIALTNLVFGLWWLHMYV